MNVKDEIIYDASKMLSHSSPYLSQYPLGTWQHGPGDEISAPFLKSRSMHFDNHIVLSVSTLLF
jgi:hypothetical protein